MKTTSLSPLDQTDVRERQNKAAHCADVENPNRRKVWQAIRWGAPLYVNAGNWIKPHLREEKPEGTADKRKTLELR